MTKYIEIGQNKNFPFSDLLLLLNTLNDDLISFPLIFPNITHKDGYQHMHYFCIIIIRRWMLAIFNTSLLILDLY